jgi:molecular chaperone GrpE
MTEERDVKVAGEEPGRGVDGEDEVLDGVVVQDGSSEGEAQRDVLADLRRLEHDVLRARADYDNLRKQSRKREADGIARAKGRVLEEMLPVLDSFEAALQHSGDDEGLQLLFKQLTQALQQQGLEEVDAAGQPFDPTLHEAVSMVDDPAVRESVVKEVYRKGYRLGDQLLRPVTVVVARPSESDMAGESPEAG